MKIAQRLLALVGLAYIFYLLGGDKALSHIIFPSVPSDIDLSPSAKSDELDMQQFFAMLTGVIILFLGLFFIFKNKVLPHISQAIIDWMTGQHATYTPEDDELVQTLQQLSSTHKPQDLSPLDELCERKPKRLRNWTEYANLLKTQCRDYEGAITVLNRAYQHIDEAEDRALILYRIASIFEQELKQADKAQEFYTQAAELYPHCVYGKMAQRK